MAKTRCNFHWNISCWCARKATAVGMILGALFFLLWQMPYSARAGDPSPEQCICNVPGASPRTGAQVVNAGSCVLEPRYPWCDIYLATTENSAAQSILVGSLKAVPNISGNTKALRAVLIPMFEGFVSSSSGAPPELHDLRKQDVGVIGELIDKNYEQIAACIQSFNKRESTKETGETLCSVGPESKWLRIVFHVGSRTYVFLFSPNV